MSATFKTLFKALQRELGIIHKKTNIHHAKKEMEKKKALLHYKKIQMIKERKPVVDIDRQLDDLEKNREQIPEMNMSVVKRIVGEEMEKNDELTQIRLQNLSNIATFLKSQREYTELLERYNPGLSMNQEENVRKSANRVGLRVPEN